MSTQVKALVSALTLSFGNSVTKGQLNFAVSIAFETLPLVAADAKFKFSQFSRQVEEASGYSISAKTVANCCSLANQLQQKYGAKIGGYAGGHRKDNVLDFASFIAEEVKTTTHKLTLDDLMAFCKGEKSAADKRADAAAAMTAAADALAATAATAAAAELTQSTDALLTDAQKKQADAEDAQKKAEEATAAAAAQAEAEKAAKIKAEELAASIAATARKQQAEAAAAQAEAEAAAAAAEEARKVAESFAVRVGVNADGTPNITLAENQSPMFLRQVANALLAEAKRIEKEVKLAMAA